MATPKITDRAAWQRELDKLTAREKAYTKEGDALAAQRRRLPMVEVDANIPLVGPNGSVSLLATFEGRQRLIAYFMMWRAGKPYEQQCDGCTFYTSQVQELAYLHQRDVTYATFCKGPYEETVRYRDFMQWRQPWYSAQHVLDQLHIESDFALVCYLRDGDRVFETYRTKGRGVEAMAPTYKLLDLTIYGRGETWEDSPAGWPQPLRVEPKMHTMHGRPSAQVEDPISARR